MTGKKLGARLFSLVFGAVLVGSATLTNAQVAAPQAHSAKLDAWLAAKNYTALMQSLQHPETAEDARVGLDWMKDQMLSGTTALVPFTYSGAIWGLGQGSSGSDRDGLSDTAAMALLYTYAAMLVDGTRCGDQSAVSKRLTEVRSYGPEIWRHIATADAAKRALFVDLAVRIEARTAARRDAIGDVDYLCRFGLEETSYNLKHGTAKELPKQLGKPGRTIELSGDGKFRPSVRTDAEWRPAAAAVRAKLPETLAKLVGSGS